MRVKELFFDRKAVIDAMDGATHSVFSKFGAFVRTRARTSIVKRKRASFPGRPPSSHVGLLRRMILFFYSRVLRSVIIGPERVAGKIGDAPHALEHGGRSTIVSAEFSAGRRGRRRRIGDRGRRRVKIKQRPFMGPAFEKEKQGLSQMWADSIRR